MKLEENHEIVGNLIGIEDDGKSVKLQFSIQKMFEIPTGVIPTEKLKGVIGNKIGIFNAGDGVFKLRKAKKR